MTTIAASLTRRMMAADSRMVLTNDTFGTTAAAACTKLLRLNGWIVGAAGDDRDIQPFFEWLRDMRHKRPKPKHEFEALMLSRTKLLHVMEGGKPEEVRAGYHAIGSGGPFALASLTTQMLLGEVPDPRVAVIAACHHDPGSREPVDILTWK